MSVAHPTILDEGGASEREIPRRNLYQRLAAITGEIGKIRATGRTEYNTPTLSIADVEDSLRDLLAKHGVVTGYRWNVPPTIVGQEGKNTIWQADLTVWLANADYPDDSREDRVLDIGSSPSGAVSFALKRYYRALFHFAAAEEETRAAGVQFPKTMTTTVVRRGPTRPLPDPANAGEAPAGGEPEAASSGQATAGLSPSPLERLQKVAEAYHKRSWAKCRMLVAAQARGVFHKSLDDLTAEEIEHLADEIDALTQSRDKVKPS